MHRNWICSIYGSRTFPECISERNKPKQRDDKNSVNRICFNEGNAAKLDYDNDIFDLAVTSSAPIYLSEAVRVLKMSGVMLISFSFNGEAFVKAKKTFALILQKII